MEGVRLGGGGGGWEGNEGQVPDAVVGEEDNNQPIADEVSPAIL